MKLIYKWLTGIILISISNGAFGQQTRQADTLYYLVDTAKIPYNDRILEVSWNSDGVAKEFKLHVPCLTNKLMPVFICNGSVNSGTVLNRRALHKLKLTDLSTLVDLICQDMNAVSYNEHFVTYFIEPLGHEYIKHKVHLLPVRIVQ